MPAKAGIQNYLKTLDSRLRGDDVKGRIKNFYETIKFGICRIENRGILDMAAKRRKKHKNKISGRVNSVCYIEQKSEF